LIQEFKAQAYSLPDAFFLVSLSYPAAAAVARGAGS